jgi:uncharacterized coiled-coil DUF342 family protein
MAEKFSNVGKRWTEEEDEELARLYIEKELDITQIAEELHRTPVSISSRLIKNKIVNFAIEARGFNTYMDSDYYKEYLKVKDEIPKKQESIMSEIKTLQNDITDIKTFMKELKEGIDEIYTFLDKYMITH